MAGGGNKLRLFAGLVTGRMYLPESEAIFAAFTTPPSTARKNAIDTFVRALIASGMWAELDTFYVMAAADAQASTINWRAPATFPLVQVGTPVFAADQGWTSAGTSWLSTGYNMGAESGRKVLVNDHSFYAASLTNTSEANATTFLAGSARLVVQPRNNSAAYSSRSASGSTDTGAVSENVGKGLFGIRRNNSANYQRDRNGTVHATVTRASASITSAVCLVCTNDGVNLSSKVLSLLAFGGYVDDATSAAFYAAYATYMNTIGTSPT